MTAADAINDQARAGRPLIEPIEFRAHDPDELTAP
jgi:hypothetical protein